MNAHMECVELCALVSATHVAIFFSPELAFGHSKRCCSASLLCTALPENAAHMRKSRMTEHTHSYTNFQMFVLVYHPFMVTIYLNCYNKGKRMIL